MEADRVTEEQQDKISGSRINESGVGEKSQLGRSAIRVFVVKECDWWAAESLEAAKADYLEFMDVPEEDAFDDPRELTADEMERFQFVDEDGTRRSFRAQLDVLVAERAPDGFPCPFASREY